VDQTVDGEPIAPAQHLQIPDLLTASEQHALVGFLRAHEDEVVASTVYPPNELRGVTDTETRSSRTLFEIDEIWPIFQERLEALLPHIRKELGLGWFELEDMERQLTIHGDGDFFTRHADRADDDHRAITYVYYFNCEPKGFSGGELRLYEESDEIPSEDAEDFIEIQPINNSVVFFPSWTHHEVAPVHSEARGLEGARFTVTGWFHSAHHELRDRTDGRGVRLDRSPIEIDQALLPDVQREVLPRFTKTGFEVIETPPEVHQLLVNEFERGKAEAGIEEADPYYQVGGDPGFLQIESGDDVLEILRPLHEQWSGVTLEPTAAYGFRIYKRGQSLNRHCDVFETHVISSVVHVASQVDQPWPLTIEDHDRKPHDVVLQPGQMLLYESATCPHGRPQPLVGDLYASLFLHYMPVEEWNWTYHRLATAAQAKGLLD
jgi:SM-20-related protein